MHSSLKVSPELLACDLIQSIHRLALARPLQHFREFCCEECGRRLKLASMSWRATLHNSAKETHFAQWIGSNARRSRKLPLEFNWPGDDSDNLINIALSTNSPALPTSFWQATTQSLVKLRDNISLTLSNSALNAPAESGTATASRQGKIIDASSAFYTLIMTEIPNWDRVSIPPELLNSKDGNAYGSNWRSLFVHIIEDGETFRLVAHKDRRANALTAREMLIASHIGRGCTFKQVGVELGISHSTVASHLYNVYAKLGIRRRSELVEWLSTKQLKIPRENQ